MRDRPIIYCGLLIFLGLATLPVWRNLAARVTAKGPAPALPAVAKQCVAPLDYMRRSHMNLLFEWRDSAVRRGVRDYAAADGKHYNMSLTGTCLGQCHGAKADFCDRCHNYTAVALPCWDCHEDSKAAPGSAR